MKKRILILIAMFVVPTLLSACIIEPWDDGYYHHWHRDRGGGYGERGGWYDGRR